jgi:hypothetical protein
MLLRNYIIYQYESISNTAISYEFISINCRPWFNQAYTDMNFGGRILEYKCHVINEV